LTDKERIETLEREVTQLKTELSKLQSDLADCNSRVIRNIDRCLAENIAKAQRGRGGR
jgi:predicted  nucleic acid-binding Zn-ribbon protein